MTGLDTVTGMYADVKLVLHPFLWPFDGTLSRFHQTEGAGMDLISLDEMLERTEPGGPDHALALKRSF